MSLTTRGGDYKNFKNSFEVEANGSEISFHNKKGPSNFPILEFAQLMMMMTVMMMMMRET